LVAEVPGRLADDIARILEPEFYVDADMIRDAVRRGASFNVIHQKSGFKVDVFVLTRSPIAQREMDRRELHTIDEGVAAYFARPRTPSCKSSTGSAKAMKSPSASGTTSLAS
jgi:hypothetical protein